jgi:hypothetical protein
MRSTTLIPLAAAMVFTGISTTAWAQKNPPGVNPTHYQCYRVIEEKPPFKERKVRLRDQFGASSAEVIKPEFICAPTLKNNLKPRDTRTHYVCYEDKGPKTPERKVEIVNQFGKEILVVAQPTVLCVPSRKYLLKQ